MKKTNLKDQRQVTIEEIENSQVLQQQTPQILQNDQQQAPKPQDPHPESESRPQPTIEQQKQSLQQANINKRKTMEQGLSPETDRTRSRYNGITTVVVARVIASSWPIHATTTTALSTNGSATTILKANQCEEETN
ncbi:hypothetical protein V8G54_029883 [Vigna mungo]|uniref:Uncharacterized protein n=1 Tax=Vigna mungo TaxID=3915 RepID=A0AAQ3MV60_VIGMU